MSKVIHPAWTPKRGKPKFDDYLTRDSTCDVYFDLEFLRQARDHEGPFEDDEWHLITAISAVVEGDDGKPVSLYGRAGKPPRVATDRYGEREVIEDFLEALLKFRGTNGVALRMFNYSGSGAEGRLWKKIRKLSLDTATTKRFEPLLPFLRYQPAKMEDGSPNSASGSGIERFDLKPVVSSSYESFPLSKDSKHGLKIVERFVPSFSRPGSLVGSEDSVAAWMRIKMLKRELESIPSDATTESNDAERTIGSRAVDAQGGCNIDETDENVANSLRRRRLEKELRRLEDSYLAYAEWDCRALYYLHKHLIALHYAAGPEADPVILGRRPTLARYGLLFGGGVPSRSGQDPVPGRRATGARHGVIFKKTSTGPSVSP